MNAVTRLTAFLVGVVLSFSSLVQPQEQKPFELLILHNNDMHARFEQTSQLSGTCSPADRELGKCYGGFPRVAYVVKKARKAAASGQGPPVLYLNAGDTYTGTAWFTIYKWRIAAEFLNALQPDAVSLGNHDIKAGTDELSPLLNNTGIPILVSNVILKKQIGKTLQKSIVFDVEGTKVGIVGYLTLDNNLLDSSSDIEYVDEVLALQEEVDNLKAKNINIIIALGHSTPAKNKEIAKQVDGVDLFISGHKNEYYFSGENVVTEIPNNEVVVQESGKLVPIIQSYSYDKYLGKIQLKFDNRGEIVQFEDKRILLDRSIVQDPDSVEILTKISSEISKTSAEVIGTTSVVLDGDSCKTEECNLGNLITDAMMYYYAIRYQGETYTDAPIAIIHAGAISASIAPSNRPASVTRGDLLTALPLESNLVAVTMNGTVLNQVLEQSVADLSFERPNGQLLQFSGIRATYDISKNPGSRLVNAVARCGTSCFVPEFFSIDDFRDYKILMPASIANGQFGYSMLEGLPREEIEYDEITCLSEYISLRSPVYPEVAGRIVFDGKDDFAEPDSAVAISSAITVLSITLIHIFV